MHLAPSLHHAPQGEDFDELGFDANERGRVHAFVRTHKARQKAHAWLHAGAQQAPRPERGLAPHEMARESFDLHVPCSASANSRDVESGHI